MTVTGQVSASLRARGGGAAREDFAPISAVSRDADRRTVQRLSGFRGRVQGWWTVVVLALALACGATQLKRPNDVAGRVAEDLLGETPDLAVSLRLARAMGERGRQRVRDEWNYEQQFTKVLHVMTEAR